MSQTQLLRLLDRGPRLASLLGLLGLLGLAGVSDSELYRLSALSFFSYLAFFHFFRRLADPGYGPTAAHLALLLPAALIPLLAPWLIGLAPVFGFLGAAGWLAVIDRAPAGQQGISSSLRRDA